MLRHALRGAADAALAISFVGILALVVVTAARNHRADVREAYWAAYWKGYNRGFADGRDIQCRVRHSHDSTENGGE